MTSELIKTAHQRFALAQEARQAFVAQAQEDLEFCAEDQWDPLARQARESSGRPCMQVDRINPSIRQIVNESRQNRPAIDVKPTGSGASEEVAKVFGGLIRHIEYDSGADIAYDVAEEYAVKTGLGYYRLMTDYEDALTFNQRLVIRPVYDPLTVYTDPFHKEADGSDMEWGFIAVDVPTDIFEYDYKDSALVKQARDGGWSSVTSEPGWVTANSIRVAEYFFKEYKSKKLYHLQNNLTGQKTVEVTSVAIEKGLKDGTLSKLAERTTDICSVRWVKMAGDEVLEETEWPSRFIPIFPVKGEEFWVNGKRFVCGAVRRARDAQRALNYLRSAQIEAVDLAPKAPFIGAAGQFDTFENDWRDANRKNLAYLEYNPVDVAGNQVSAPARSSVEPAIQAIIATGNTASDDLKAIFGIYDASLGNQGNETSGVAILARKEQSSNSNFHYYDNLVRSIKHLGRVLVEVIPKFYDAERTIRIVKPNGDQELKVINDLMQEKPIDFGVGKYDVVVKTGPTYQTKRQQMVEQGTALIQAYPNAGPLIADLLVSASDFEGSQEIAARLRSQVPAEVLQATGEDDGADPKQKAQALQQALSQANKNLQALNAHAAEVEKALKLKEEELNLTKLEHKTDLTKAEMDYNLKAQDLALQEAIAELEWTTKQQAFDLQKQQLELQAAQAASKVITEQHRAETERLKHSAEMSIATISAVKPLPEVQVGSDADPDLGGKFGTGKELD